MTKKTIKIDLVDTEQEEIVLNGEPKFLWLLFHKSKEFVLDPATDERVLQNCKFVHSFNRIDDMHRYIRDNNMISEEDLKATRINNPFYE